MLPLPSADLALGPLLLGSTAAALLGGLHCAGMCGAVSGMATRTQDQLWYQGGRLMSYLLLGFLAGSLGQEIYRWLPRDRWNLAGLIILFVMAYWMAKSLGWNEWWARQASRVWKSLWPYRRRLFLPDRLMVGALTGLMPCGWLYGFVGVGATLGDPWRATLIMGSLWVGSTPWLFTGAWALRKLGPRFGVWLQPVLFLIFLGSLLLQILLVPDSVGADPRSFQCH